MRARASFAQVVGIALLVGIAGVLASLVIALLVELLSVGSVRW